MSEQQASIFVDETHCGGRHVTGLERITLELFSEEALAPLCLTPLKAASRPAMMFRQNLVLPARLMKERKAIALTPGFPPAFLLSLFGARVIPYIHDMFLMTRWGDLSLNAKLYMAGPFRFAVGHLPRFFVNSESTAGELRKVCRADAEILLYRPAVRNVFGLVPPPIRPRASGELTLTALGTVEPRKNLAAAVRVLTALRAGPFPQARLEIVGRIGWGREADALAGAPGVTLHGYQPAEVIRDLIGKSDALISTAHDEGLGLPLLEAQYAGLPVIAPVKPVFREVLGESGILIDPAKPEIAAQTITETFGQHEAAGRQRVLSLGNLDRWNAAARSDREKVIALLTMLTMANGAPGPERLEGRPCS